MPINSLYQEFIRKFIHPTLDPKGTDIHVEIEHTYKERARLQRNELAIATEDPDQEWWDREDGKYSEPYSSLLNSESMRLFRPECPQLNGDELFILKHIRSLLESNTDHLPLKIVDVGGMYGMSWVKIAEQLQNEILDKKVEMIVTNLHFNPINTRSNLKHSRDETFSRLSEEDWETWKNYHHLVNFINCPTQELPSGLDLVYERDSVTYHSYTPGLERLNMLSKLTEGGLLITSDKLHMKSGRNSEEISDGVRNELKAFNIALMRSCLFKNHVTISINDQKFPIQEKWKIISKNRAELSYKMTT